MTDSMKFGPEWLRNLSSEGNTSSTSGGGSRYYLAEHRYGREEMLALFEQSLKLRPPASMMSFTSLYVDQALNPLALAPMTEEENRMWSGRGAPPGAPRGRGGSMDRGRGRSRGGTFHPGFNRSNSAYDEPMRSFDRSQTDRGWSERNGEIGDWGVGTSPRKEFGSSRGGMNNTDNWRRHRLDDPDSDGWRTMNHRNAGVQEKWAGGGGGGSGGRNLSNNWRDGDTREEHVHLSDRQANNRVSWHSSGDSRGSSQRRMFDMDDHLPEWATENPSESGGTFDASGAFHGSDDEFPPEKGSTSAKLNNNGGNSNSVLQKSASQQNIPPVKKSTPLSTSQSATNLTKKLDDSGNKENKEKSVREEKSSPMHQPRSKKSEEFNCSKQEPEQHVNIVQQPTNKEEVKENDISRKSPQAKNKQDTITNTKKVDDEFDHMKEVTDDIVAKLILDDELPKATTINETQQQQQQRSTVNSSSVAPLSYPAGLMPAPPGTAQDKWYYRDPQGEVQGPFTSQEMADWFRAGYFTISLLVRRQCDERYFTLGDLVKQCPGIPFLTCRLPPLKPDPVNLGLSKVPPELPDPIQMQQIHMQNLLQRHAEAVRALSQTEPWSALSHLQQRELITQHMISHQQPGLSDLPFIPPIANTQINNPLMHMINQMQQANKLPMQPPIVDKPPNSINTQHLDPLQQLVQQMGGMQPQLQTPTPAATEPAQQQAEDPIKSLLRQLASQQPQRDIWDIRGSQASFSNQSPQPQQWQPPAPGPGPLPHSMWDLHSQNNTPIVPPPILTPTSVAMQQRQSQPPLAVNNPLQQPSNNVINDTATKEHHDREEQKKKAEMDKEQKAKERKETAEREKKKKEQEQLEKAKALKEAEEKRKEEQRKREAERKAELEKQKKDEERIRKELEKAKREAEERKAKELEEKRKLKEQKKAEEEARKKQEEDRKREEEEDKQKKESERQEQARRQVEALRRMQEQQQRTKVAPWCQTTNETSNLSLADIQRAEREKRAEQAAILLQQQRAMAVAKDIQEQQVVDKSSLQLKWATKKPAQPKKVKSLAEIQAEEQERVAKQAAEARLLQQQKEKESTAVPVTNTSIWSTASQSLTWTTNLHSSSGFWDDSVSVQKTPTKPSTVKNNTTVVSNANSVQQQANNKTNGKVNKSRVKKEEQQVMKLFDKNDKNDEFAAWCTKTLATLNGDVDIPTFVGFLRDIESPYEVKDYVRQYLGDSPQALHFANQFVERRSRVKELQRAALQHKDDLCQPAPAINPSSEFQEVKGKGKKSKKSKMMKVDARILGFSVTAAEDRINVGDRDYGDNI